MEILGQVEATTAWFQVTVSTRSAVAIIERSNPIAAECLLGGILLRIETRKTDVDGRRATVALMILGRPADAESLTGLLDRHWTVLEAFLAPSLVGFLRWAGQSLAESTADHSIAAVGARWLGFGVVVHFLEVAVRVARVKPAKVLFANGEAASVAFTLSVLLKPTPFLGILEFPVEVFNPRVGFGFLCEYEEGASDNGTKLALGRMEKIMFVLCGLVVWL